MFLRVLDIAVVTKDGELVSRWRALCRLASACGLVTLPVWLAAAPMAGIRTHLSDGLEVGLVVAAAVIFVAGAGWAVANPERGLQDRIAGTYLVPR